MSIPIAQSTTVKEPGFSLASDRLEDSGLQARKCAGARSIYPPFFPPFPRLIYQAPLPKKLSSFSPTVRKCSPSFHDPSPPNLPNKPGRLHPPTWYPKNRGKGIFPPRRDPKKGRRVRPFLLSERRSSMPPSATRATALQHDLGTAPRHRSQCCQACQQMQVPQNQLPATCPRRKTQTASTKSAQQAKPRPLPPTPLQDNCAPATARRQRPTGTLNSIDNREGVDPSASS
jgi:hypothetical protein